MQRAVYILLLSVFLWDAGLSTAMASFTFTPYDVPDSLDTWINGINNVGQIVGSFVDATSVGHGFLRRRVIVTPSIPPAVSPPWPSTSM
jgi:hypothetical protein